MSKYNKYNNMGGLNPIWVAEQCGDFDDNNYNETNNYNNDYVTNNIYYDFDYSILESLNNKVEEILSYKEDIIKLKKEIAELKATKRYKEMIHLI